MLTVEEEAFTLHLLDTLENMRVEKRLLKIVECLAENCEDIKSVIKRLRNYTKSLRKEENVNTTTPLSSFLKSNEVFEKIIEELCSIGHALHWEDRFMEILKYYLSTRNISICINFLSSYNQLYEMNQQFEQKSNELNFTKKL